MKELLEAKKIIKKYNKMNFSKYLNIYLNYKNINLSKDERKEIIKDWNFIGLNNDQFDLVANSMIDKIKSNRK